MLNKFILFDHSKKKNKRSKINDSQLQKSKLLMVSTKKTLGALKKKCTELSPFLAFFFVEKIQANGGPFNVS
jgi:hypothetical protein